jgi:hypothetical protein
MKVTAAKARMVAAGVASLGFAGALMLAASPATAAEREGAAQRCAVNVQTGRTACASDEARAVQLAGISPQAVRAVTLYDGTGYTGASITYYVARPCTAGYDGEYGVPNLGADGWNNRASSLKTYNRCDAHLHDGVNYTGAVSTWIHQASNLATIGAGWSNRASSMGIS